MSQLSIQHLLNTDTTAIRNVVCRGECRHKSAEECTHATHLVFPYRGVYVRHLGRDDAVAEANQVLFYNNAEGYRVSHPLDGGDACLDFVISEPWLRELAPKEQVRTGGVLAFRRQRLRIDSRAQALVALLRHGLSRKVAETLEAETLALTLARRALGERTSHAAGASAGRQKLADRAKLVLSSDLARRWTLAEIAAETGTVATINGAPGRPGQTRKRSHTPFFARYPHKEDSSFDFERYARSLAPMYARLLGDNCVKFEVRRGLVTPGRPAPHFVCIASYWVKSREQFGASLADPGMKDLMERISAFTDIEPIRQFDEVVV